MSVAMSPGTLFARDYRIVAPLGQGGMGALYVAEQLSTGKRRALKLMHPTLVSEAEHRERFVREAQVGSRIASEHVVEVTAAGVDEASGLPFIAMELLEGETLQSYVKRRAFLPPAETALVFQQLCHAMTAAHSAGIVHRDLKPENVFLALSRRAGGAPFVVKVLDFGIAKLAAEAGTRGTTGAMGSPLWMAPEQTERGTITAAADVWALGLIAYFTLTGTVFWRSARDPQTTVAQILREIVLEPIPAASIRANEAGLLERLPPGFDRFFAQSVARDPSARFPDASAFSGGISAMLEATGATMAALPPSSGMRPQAQAPRPATPAPPTPRPASGGAPAPAAMGTAPGVANTMTRSASLGPWIFASALVMVGAFAAIAYVALRARAKEPTASEAPATSQALQAAATAPSATAAAPLATSPTTTATATAAAPSATAAGMSAAPAPRATARTQATATAAAAAGGATDVSHGANDTYVSGLHKARTWKVAGHTIRVVPGNVRVSGNVPANVVRDALDWQPWQYLRCYEKYFSSATSLPRGTVTLTFKVFDQLPRQGAIDRSDFSNPAFSKCVLDTAMGETVNAAGPNGFATVTYPLVFSVVD